MPLHVWIIEIPFFSNRNWKLRARNELGTEYAFPIAYDMNSVTTLCLSKGLKWLRVPGSWAPQATRSGTVQCTHNPSKPLLRNKV